MKSITESQIFALCQSGDDFPVDFDLAWKWIGYGKKSDAKESLLSKGFLERIDYLRIDPQLGTLAVPRSKESIKLTTECFKTWAMMAQTAKGTQVRLYFLECERKLKQLVFNAPQPQLKPIDLLNLDDRMLLPFSLPDGKFVVHSIAPKQGITHSRYLVSISGKNWNCSCPNHQFRGVECKHIDVVRSNVMELKREPEFLKDWQASFV